MKSTTEETYISIESSSSGERLSSDSPSSDSSSSASSSDSSSSIFGSESNYGTEQSWQTRGERSSNHDSPEAFLQSHEEGLNFLFDSDFLGSSNSSRDERSREYEDEQCEEAQCK